MRLRSYFLSVTLLLTLIVEANVPLGCLKIERSVSQTYIGLITKILGEWLPLDTLNGKVYLNHHMPFILTDNEGIYLSTLPKGRDSDKCITEEYNTEDRTCTLYFVYDADRKIPDYCYQIKVIDTNILEWYYFAIDRNGKKLPEPYGSYRTIRKGNEHNYASYNNILPKEVQNKTWLHIGHYRGNYYYSEENEDTQFLRTFVDSIATRDAYNGSFVTEAVKHCRTHNDTIFIYANQ